MNKYQKLKIEYDNFLYIKKLCYSPVAIKNTICDLTGCLYDDIDDYNFEYKLWIEVWFK